jgi:hypothetical protein
MFQSYSIEGHFSSISIIDSEFSHYRVIDRQFDYNRGLAECVGYHVIKAYEKRSLPVAANLIKAFLYHSKTQHYDLDFIIWMNKQHNPIFSRYEKDIEKYLLLI